MSASGVLEEHGHREDPGKACGHCQSCRCSGALEAHPALEAQWRSATASSGFGIKDCSFALINCGATSLWIISDAHFYPSAGTKVFLFLVEGCYIYWISTTF